jgi:predicted 2-oxoglutarate/Fe(II)-dependent dioxygenase YbiX
MPNASIFAGLGLFTRRGFLDGQACRQIRQEMSAAALVPAMVRPVNQAAGEVNDTARRTGIATVAAETAALVEQRLLALRPALEAHFHVPLAGCQAPQFYIYEEGDFFLPHRDRDNDPLAPEHVKARQVAISVFLNDGTEGPDRQPYRGGALVFYGSRGGPGGAAFGIPLESEEGMCVGFRSDWVHEVRPITSGRRYCIVTWFY